MYVPSFQTWKLCPPAVIRPIVDPLGRWPWFCVQTMTSVELLSATPLIHTSKAYS